MKRWAKLSAVLVCLCVLLSGCKAIPASGHTGTESGQETIQGHIPESRPEEPKIPFADGQYYAAAYLGYENMEALERYSQEYLNGEEVPVHRISDGEYYLIIPRFAGMALEIYANELEPQQSVLFYESENAEPFVIQCNISDIFPNSTIRFVYQDTEIEFSPYLSLMDGSLQIGPHGMDITVEE